MIKENKLTRFFTSLLGDKGLTKKAYLNAFASTLDYGVRLLVGLVIQPLLVLGLGDYFFGLWQVLNRVVGYITPASGRPTYALKFTLANLQASSDFDAKRSYVGSTLVVWLIFLPLLTVLGAVLAWVVPGWLDVPEQYTWYVRLTILILVANVSMTSLGALPQSVLQGENLGYKRLGLSLLLVLVGGGLTWLAIYLNTGIAGVAAAALLSTILSGIFYLVIVKKYAPWFGIDRPAPGVLKKFLRLSGWFLAWNLVMSLMNASDVVILGKLDSIESVTPYTLTKYVPETLISLMAIVIYGIAPGFGGIIGSGDYKKAADLRAELMSITWLLATSAGFTILLWNKGFINLWVDARQFAGVIPSLLIVLVVVQFVLIRVDVNMIDLTLDLSKKVILGFISAAISILVGGILVAFYDMGIIGVTLGLILGRSLLSIGYPLIVGRFLQIPLASQVKGIFRPASVTIFLFAFAMLINIVYSDHALLLPDGWLEFAFLTGLTALLALAAVFFLGLSNKQRRKILRRLKVLLPASSKK